MIRPHFSYLEYTEEFDLSGQYSTLQSSIFATVMATSAHFIGTYMCMFLHMYAMMSYPKWYLLWMSSFISVFLTLASFAYFSLRRANTQYGPIDRCSSAMRATRIKYLDDVWKYSCC